MYLKSLFIAAVIFLSGCAGPDTRIIKMNDLEDVEILQTVQRKEKGLLHAYVTIKNEDDDPRTLYYRFVWTDKMGLPVGDDEIWKTRQLLGEQRLTLKGSAMTEQAENFSIELAPHE